MLVLVFLVSTSSHYSYTGGDIICTLSVTTCQCRILYSNTETMYPVKHRADLTLGSCDRLAD